MDNYGGTAQSPIPYGRTHEGFGDLYQVLSSTWSGSLVDFREGRALTNEEWFASRVGYATLTLRQCVEIDPKKRSGVPVLRGTRFTVSQLIAEIADGRTVTEVADDFELDHEVIKQFLDCLAIYLDRPAAK